MNDISSKSSAPLNSVVITPELYATLIESIHNLAENTKSLDTKLDDLNKIYHADIRKQESRLSKVETKLHVAGAVAGTALAAAVTSLIEMLVS